MADKPNRTCRKCGKWYERRDAGFIGWVWGCPTHSHEWMWHANRSSDPNTRERQIAIDKHCECKS